MAKFFYLLAVIAFSFSNAALAQTDFLPRVKCATPEVFGISKEKNQDLARLQSAFNHTSPSGKFIVYYDRTGSDAIPLTDTQGGPNGVPDYAETVARSADESYAAMLGYGFPDPLTGSTQPYPIYIENIASAYGYMQTSNTSPHDTFIGINNNFTGFNPQLNTDELIQVTVAHELKHVIQFKQTRLGNFESTNWREYDAALMEDVVYDSANDYYLFVNTSLSIFRAPEVPIRPASISELGKGYYKMTFNHYYYEKFGIQFWVDVWAKIEAQNSMTMKAAMSEALEERGSNWETEFNRMFLWHSATQSDINYNYGFEERANFPDVKRRYALGNSANVQSKDSTLSNIRLNPTAADFYQVNAPLINQNLQIAFFPRLEDLQGGVLRFQTGGGVEEILLSTENGYGLTTVNSSATDKVEMSIANASTSTPAQYDLIVGKADSYQLFTWGDVNSDNAITTLDAALTLKNIVNPTLLYFNGKQKAAANISGKRGLTPFDAALLLKETANSAATFSLVDDNNDGFGPDASFFNEETTSFTKLHIDADNATAIAAKSSSQLASSFDLVLERLTGATVESFYLEFKIMGSNLAFESYDATIAGLPAGSLVDAHFDNSTNTLKIVGALSSAAQLSNLGSVNFNFASVITEIQLVQGYFDERNTGFKQVEGQLLSVDDNISNIPTQISLNQNFPNPFNPTTQIGFELPQSANVNLVVLNSVGQQVATLAQGPYTAGSHQINFDASGLASGVYIYILQANSTRILKKMTLLK